MKSGDALIGNQVIGAQGLKRFLYLRERGLASSMIIQGPAGCGKTHFGKKIAAEHGIFVRARQSWATKALVTDLRSMLGDFLETIRGGPWAIPFSVRELYRELKAEIEKRGIKITVVDEADYLSGVGSRHELLNVLRDLSDETGAGTVFLSIADLAQRLASTAPYVETLTTRLMGTISFKRPSLPDAALLSRLVEGVTLGRDVIAFCLRASHGSIRPLMRLYGELEDAAAKDGVRGPLSLQRCIDLRLNPVSQLCGHTLPRSESTPEPAPDQDTVIQPAIELVRKASA